MSSISKIIKGTPMPNEIESEVLVDILKKYGTQKQISNKNNVVCTLYGIPKNSPRYWYVVKETEKKRRLLCNNIKAEDICFEILSTFPKWYIFKLLLQTQGIMDFLTKINNIDTSFSTEQIDIFFNKLNKRPNPKNLLTVSQKISKDYLCNPMTDLKDEMFKNNCISFTEEQTNTINKTKRISNKINKNIKDNQLTRWIKL